jgi:integrase
MDKQNFTPERVASYRCAPDRQQSIFWDRKQPGLGLRVTRSGSRAYICEARLFGKTVRLTIGTPEAWPLERYITTDKVTGEKIERMGARQEAARLKALMDRDIDPREEKAEQRAAHEIRKANARRQDVTVTEVWAEYLKANQARWSERHYQDHENLAQAGGEEKKRGKGLTVAGPLAPLMPLRLASLYAKTVAAWLQSESEIRPTNAAQSYRKLRAFIRWCEDRPEYTGIVPPDAYSARPVREAVPRGNAKDDCLQREQLAAWFGTVQKIDNPVISTYLQGLLITGARREELAALRWDDVDFRWRSLHLADKIEIEAGRTIPLTPYLASLLLELKRVNETPPNTRQLRRLEERGEKWAPSPWVFSSKTSADGKLAEPRIAHTKALAAAALPHVSLHGLRRSFGTLAEWCEVPVGVVAQIQGHKPSALAEKHYRRRPLDLLRSWHDKIEAWMLAQGGISFVPEKRQALNAVTAA